MTRFVAEPAIKLKLTQAIKQTKILHMFLQVFALDGSICYLILEHGKLEEMNVVISSLDNFESRYGVNKVFHLDFFLRVHLLTNDLRKLVKNVDFHHLRYRIKCDVFERLDCRFTDIVDVD